MRLAQLMLNSRLVIREFPSRDRPTFAMHITDPPKFSFTLLFFLYKTRICANGPLPRAELTAVQLDNVWSHQLVMVSISYRQVQERSGRLEASFVVARRFERRSLRSEGAIFQASFPRPSVDAVGVNHGCLHI